MGIQLDGDLIFQNGQKNCGDHTVMRFSNPVPAPVKRQRQTAWYNLIKTARVIREHFHILIELISTLALIGNKLRNVQSRQLSEKAIVELCRKLVRV